MEQKGGNNNQTTANETDCKGQSYCGAKQLVRGDNAELVQKNTRNSEMVINNAIIGSRGGSWQTVRYDKLKVRQQNGSNNKVVLNRTVFD